MPGVSKDGLGIKADRNSLVIEGNAVIDMPDGMEAMMPMCKPPGTGAASR